MAIQFVGDLILFDAGLVAMDPACCCTTECPCCYYGITIHRGAGDTLPVRQPSGGSCALGADTFENAFQCGDETFMLLPDASEGCVCYYTKSSDTDNYSSDPCTQQYYTESSLDVVCNYTRGGRPGKETHIGTMSFRNVYLITLCYDPCGTATVTINHKIYCNFGVYIHDEPPPFYPVTDTWVDVSTDLVFDSTWTWSGVSTTNCTVDPDLGATTSSSLASVDFTKVWGTAFINAAYGCSTPSSFTVDIPKPCAATGLTLIGGGVPCNCLSYFTDSYFPSGYVDLGFYI